MVADNGVYYTQEDQEWLEDLLSTMSDHSVWGCPCTFSVFKFNKPDKTYSIECPVDADEFIANRITIKILGKLGYKRVEVDGDDTDR